MGEERSVVDLRRKIEELRLKLSEAKQEREASNDEGFQWAEKRGLLHERIRELRSDAMALKDKRDALNNEIQGLKATREEKRAVRGEKIDQIKGLRLKIRGAAVKSPPRNAAGLTKEIKAIDWKIQTNSLSLDEEKRLVEQVRDLESQLARWRIVDGLKSDIAKLQGEVGALSDEIRSTSEKIALLASQSQKFHEEMMTKLEKTRKLKTEADEKHKEYVRFKEKAHAAHLKYLEILSQITPLQRAIRENEEKKKADATESLRSKLEKEATEKLKQRKKLTFDEFKILAEQGKI